MTVTPGRDKPRILLLATGGTIASEAGADGMAPSITAEDLVASVPGIAERARVTPELLMNIDSSNMQPEHWRKIARAIGDRAPGYDGVVVTHGTDTMAYTSSMLSFMLRDLGFPVVLTGSQRTIREKRSDAPRNLLDAVTLASAGPPGVYLVFAGIAIRGARAKKLRSKEKRAFASVNAPTVARISGGKIAFSSSAFALPVQGRAPGKVRVDDSIDSRVALLKLVPGTPPELFASLPAIGFSGVVVEAFGAGGVPFLDGGDLVPALRDLVKQGVPVVIVSQCIYNGCDLQRYEVGVKALRAGAICGYDMTVEAAVTKLMWVLGHTRDPAEVKKLMLTPLAGEISGTG